MQTKTVLSQPAVIASSTDKPPDKSPEQQALALYKPLAGYTDDEKFQALNIIWIDADSGNAPKSLIALAKSLQSPLRKQNNQSTEDSAMLRQVRVELTKLLIKDSPNMAGMADQFEELLNSASWKSGDDVDLKRLVSVNVRANEKTASARSNLFFSFLHLVSLNLKAPAIKNIHSALTIHANASGEAKKAISEAKRKVDGKLNETAIRSALKFKEKAEKIDKAMLRHAALAQMTAHVCKRVTYLFGSSKTDPDRTQSSLLCQKAMDIMPNSIRSQAGWERVTDRMQKYTSHTAEIQGEHFRSLLAEATPKLPELLASFKCYSRLPVEDEKKMVFERQLWNIQNDLGSTNSPPNSTNNEVIGAETSYANKTANGSADMPHPVLQPGNQVAVAMHTPLRTDSGMVRNLVVLSCVSPALDSPDQPDFQTYVRSWEDDERIPLQELNQSAYLDAFNTIAEQVLNCADDNPQCDRIVLPAIGLNSFLGALTRDQQSVAIDIGSNVLAKLVVDLRSKGKEVVFTDSGTKSERMNGINALLGDFPLTLAGSIPGDWISDNDLIVNAWDPHSLVGNKLAKDNSIDGFIGRNSLVHFMHGLHCAAFTEGVKLAGLSTEN
jgi:hypothetical protein